MATPLQGNPVSQSDPPIWEYNCRDLRVKQRLDLERIQTAIRYVERYATDLIEQEEEML